MHNHELEKVLAKQFSQEGFVRITDYFKGKSLSPNGEEVLVAIILSAKRHAKRLVEIFAAFDREWKKTWEGQASEVRGDPLAPDLTGNYNRTAMANICQILAIPNVLDGRIITSEPLVVETESSVYRIGPADDNGERDIIREPNPLPFTRCRITFLLARKPMVFVPINFDSGEPWGTSDVRSIIHAEVSSVTSQ